MKTGNESVEKNERKSEVLCFLLLQQVEIFVRFPCLLFSFFYMYDSFLFSDFFSVV